MTTDTAEPLVLEPHEQEITTRVLDSTASLVDDARAVQVRDDEEAELATDFLSMIAGERKRAEDARTFLVKPLNDHVKMINARFKGPAEILKQADAIVREKVLSYRADVERRRQEEIRRLEAEERERVRVEREAQESREAAARELAERAAAEARRAEEAARADEGALAQAAAAAEFAAATAALEQQRAAAPPPAALPIRAPAQRHTLGSAASRKRWVGVVVEPRLVPREYLVVDQAAINAAVKRGVRTIPGVLIEERDELAVRAR